MAKLGVVLFNLGGPERLEDVKPFLFNLFSDPEILSFRQAWLRTSVAWLIATLRHRRSCGYYEKIGGGSPLRRITEEQAAELKAALLREGIEAEIYVGMRCWKPTIDEAIERMLDEGVTRVVGLPLYPQFSVTSTGSALKYFEQAMAARNRAKAVEYVTIREWYDDPRYVEALAETIRSESERFPDPDPAKIHLVYSAHSIPVRYVERGDPYAEQTRQTVELVNRSLGNRSRSTLAFQSKVGWQKWLEPATAEVIADLGRSGTRQVLAIPVSFVSDHIETLYEMDMLFRDLATAAGIPHFRRAPALNCSPRFIGALAGLVRRGIAELDENTSRSAGASSRRA